MRVLTYTPGQGTVVQQEIAARAPILDGDVFFLAEHFADKTQADLALIVPAYFTGWVRLTLPPNANLTAYYDAFGVLLHLAAIAWRQVSEMQHFNQLVAEQVARTRIIALNDLATAIAHQLNNPMTTMLAETEMLLSGTPAHTPTHDTLLAIQRAGRRTTDLMNRLRMVSHPKATDHLQWVMIRETIEDVLRLLQVYIQAENINLSLSLEADLAPVWAVPMLLTDVWFNLLMNARDEVLQQSDRHIGIQLKSGSDTNEVLVIIWDNGAGIPLVDYERIFQPFYTTRSPHERLGLGLYICKQIVEDLNGALNVARHKGGGAQFTVRLPAKKGD